MSGPRTLKNRYFMGSLAPVIDFLHLNENVATRTRVEYENTTPFLINRRESLRRFLPAITIGSQPDRPAGLIKLRNLFSV